MRSFPTILFIAAAVLAPVRTRADVTPAAGFTVRTIRTPTPAQGGVVWRGNALLVGQGSFGAGTESIVRLDGALATTIAAGFNSLGGFDLDGTTLYTVDNCYGTDFGCTGATTGDSLYAIADATSRTDAAAAAASAVLPAGSIAAGQDVLAIPGAVLVSDAVGVGAGRVVKIVGTTPSNLLTGLDFLGGLASDGTTLDVANVDGTFVGAVKAYTLAGAPVGTLVGGLSGAYGIARDDQGDVLVTGGFTGDFTSSTLLAVDSGGHATEWAHGFGFSSDVFFDPDRGTALVLDFGVAAVTAVCRDADGDAVCDADCSAPAAVAKPVLKIGKQQTALGDDTLKFKGAMTIPGAPDPVATGARLLVDDADGRVVVDVTVPPGAYDKATKSGWKVNKQGTAWRFTHPTGVLGVKAVALKRSTKTPGLVTFVVSAKDGAYAAADAALPVHAVLRLAPAGQCGLATFAGPTSACAFDGKTLACK